MLTKSRKIFNVFVLMVSLVFCLGFFAGCKDDEETETPPPQPVVVALSADMINLEYTTTVYDRSEKTPEVTIKNGETVIDSDEYTVEYSDNTVVGTATVSVSAVENSAVLSGSAEKTFEITIADLPEITAIPSVGFNNTNQVPIVVIEGLHLGTDFDASWEYRPLEPANADFEELDTSVNNFKNVGEYKVTAVGKGNYDGTQTAIFVVYNELPQVEPIASAVYNKTSQVPTVVLTNVEVNTDYTLSYEYKSNFSNEFVALDVNQNNFVDAGEYKIIASGKGIYGGQKTTIYTIEAIEVLDPSVSEEKDYTGASQPAVVTVSGLVENQDYQIKWLYKEIGADDSEYAELNKNSNNFVNAGEYKAQVKGVGNYKETKEIVYVINRISLPGLQISKANYIYNDSTTNANVVGNIENAEIRFMMTDVEEDKDDKSAASWQEYKNGEKVDAGVYYMYATALATTNYDDTDSELISFEIYKDDLPNLPVLVGVDYTGLSQKPTIELKVNGETLVAGENASSEGCDYYIYWEYEGLEYVLDADESKNFVNAGKYTAYLYSYYDGNYDVGTSTTRTMVNFWIYKVELSSFRVKVTNGGYEYSDTAKGFGIFEFDLQAGTGFEFTVSVEDGELVCSAGGTVKVYYNTTTSLIGGDGWVEYTADTVLNAGTYFLYAEIINNPNGYDEIAPVSTTFRVEEPSV